MSILDSETRDRLAAIVCESFRLIDVGRATSAASIFARGATLTFGPGAPSPGILDRSGIETFLAKRENIRGVTSRHALSNFLFEQSDDGSVLVRSLMTLFKGEGNLPPASVTFVADLADLFVVQDGNWLIAKRTISPVFA